MKTWRELISEIKHEDMDKPVVIHTVYNVEHVEQLEIQHNRIVIIPVIDLEAFDPRED